MRAGGAAAAAIYDEPAPDLRSEPAPELRREPPPEADEDEIELARPDEEPDREAQFPAWHESRKEPTAVEMKSVATGAELVSATVARATSGAFAKLSEAIHKTPPEELRRRRCGADHRAVRGRLGPTLAQGVARREPACDRRASGAAGDPEDRAPGRARVTVAPRVPKRAAATLGPPSRTRDAPSRLDAMARGLGSLAGAHPGRPTAAGDGSHPTPAGLHRNERPARKPQLASVPRHNAGRQMSS